jgi:hypothetical protein
LLALLDDESGATRQRRLRRDHGVDAVLDALLVEADS